MDEKWTNVIEQCRKLAEQTGTEVPAVFDKPPAGRLGANPFLREGVMLDHLGGFLETVNRKLARKQASKPKQAPPASETEKADGGGSQD